MRTMKVIAMSCVVTAALAATAGTAAAQATPPSTAPQPLPTTPVCAPIPVDDATANGTASSTPNGNGAAATAPDYVIGVDDVLTIKFWRDDTMSGDFIVRPDGKISMPLINEIVAAGLTPMELCNHVTKAATQFLEGPRVSVVVKQINSRRVFITGNVGKPGPYPMSGRLDILQLITLAGGLQEFAKKKEILIIRNENGKNLSFKVNYDDISKGKNLNQIIELKPGDQVIVR